MEIKLNNVDKMWNQNDGLKNINYKFNTNECIGILGPNGAGKSTLIKLIQGLIFPKSGEIFLNDKRTDDNKFDLSNVGYIQSDDFFDKQLNVKEYIRDFKTINSGHPNKIAEIAKIFDFNINSYTKLGKLSTGMSQLLKICTTFGYDKEIYILDEPTSGLDPLKREAFLDYVDSIKENKLIIYCTHLVEEVSRLCQKVIIIKNNTLFNELQIDKKTDLLNHYKEIYSVGKGE